MPANPENLRAEARNIVERCFIQGVFYFAQADADLEVIYSQKLTEDEIKTFMCAFGECLVEANRKFKQSTQVEKS